MREKNTELITFISDSELKKSFYSRFENFNISHFFRNCMKMALYDSQFFNDVFEIKNDVKKIGIETQKSIF